MSKMYNNTLIMDFPKIQRGGRQPRAKNHNGSFLLQLVEINLHGTSTSTLIRLPSEGFLIKIRKKINKGSGHFTSNIASSLAIEKMYPTMIIKWLGGHTKSVKQ